VRIFLVSEVHWVGRREPTHLLVLEGSLLGADFSVSFDNGRYGGHDMAKKPVFYPVLRLEKRRKNSLDHSSRALSQPVEVIRRAVADRKIKSTGQYIANAINHYSVAQIGLEERTFTSNPGWRQTVAAGADAGSTYYRNFFRYKPAHYSVRSENSLNLSYGVGSYDGSVTNLEKAWEPLIERATASVKRKLDGNIGKAQLAAPVAESREIHRLVRQINTLGTDTLKALLAIKKTRGKSAFKQFGNIWLGFGFGVNPLIKDVESAARSILDYTIRQDRQVRITGTAVQDYHSAATTLSPQQIAWGCSMGFKDSFTHTQGVRIVAGMDLKLRSAASYSVADHLGLKVGMIPSVAWELTPFSWVVDYFVTVGPWLDDMFYTLPGETTYISMTQKYQNEIINFPYARPSGGYTAHLSPTPGRGRYISFYRTKLTSLPSRAIRIKSADQVAQFGLTKLLNLGSVLAQKWK